MMQLADANQMGADAGDPQSAAPGLGDELVAERWGQAIAVRDRSFWLALGVAILLHSTLFLGLLRHQPRAVGDEGGSDDGISVSVVTEADLQSRSSVAEEGGPPPGAPAPAVKPAPPPPPPTPEPETKPAEPTPPQEAVQAPPPPPSAPELKPSVDVAKELTEEVPDLLALPGEGAAPAKKAAPKPDKPFETKVTDAKTSEAKTPPEAKAQPQTPPQQKPKPPQKRTAALDLTPPAASFSGSAGGGGRSAGFERPPGITKSGANDAFARAVIRALQQTMPQLRETLGRVTVRIILNQNGNVESVEIVRPSKIASLDQSVVFATKQTSYPFPPPNSNLADRTFVVTYIYH